MWCYGALDLPERQFPSSRPDARNLISANSIHASSICYAVSGRRSFDSKDCCFFIPKGTWVVQSLSQRDSIFPNESESKTPTAIETRSCVACCHRPNQLPASLLAEKSCK